MGEYKCWALHGTITGGFNSVAKLCACKGGCQLWWIKWNDGFAEARLFRSFLQVENEGSPWRFQLVHAYLTVLVQVGDQT